MKKGIKRKILGAKSRLLTNQFDGQRCWFNLISLHYFMVNNVSSGPFLVFRTSLKTSVKQIVVHHSEFLRYQTVSCYSSAVVATITWPILLKKWTTSCFEVLLPWTTFVGSLIRINPWFATCDDLQRRLFKHRDLIFL